MALEFLYEPIQRASVFSQLTFKPDAFANMSSTYKILEKERSESSKIIVVSSAY